MIPASSGMKRLFGLVGREIFYQRCDTGFALLVLMSLVLDFRRKVISERSLISACGG
jgi:hypothetical protein